MLLMSKSLLIEPFGVEILISRGFEAVNTVFGKDFGLIKNVLDVPYQASPSPAGGTHFAFLIDNTSIILLDCMCSLKSKTERETACARVREEQHTAPFFRIYSGVMYLLEVLLCSRSQ
jgi:hypothetical protein